METYRTTPSRALVLTIMLPTRQDLTTAMDSDSCSTVLSIIAQVRSCHNRSTPWRTPGKDPGAHADLAHSDTAAKVQGTPLQSCAVAETVVRRVMHDVRLCHRRQTLPDAM